MEAIPSIYETVSTLRPWQGMGDLAAAGFKRLLLDFSMFTSAELIRQKKHRPELVRELYREFFSTAKKFKMEFPIAKLPFFSHFSCMEDLHPLILQLSLDCLAACETAGCGQIIVQPLFVGLEHDRVWEENRKYYLALSEACRLADTKLLLTNQYAVHNRRFKRGVCSDGRTAAQWVDDLNCLAGMERFGFCMDTGYCNLCAQDMQAFILGLGARLQAVILTENDGQHDMRRLPFTGGWGQSHDTDWLGVIRGLRQSGFDGCLILDMVHTIQSFSPLLRPHILSLCKAVADYFLLQANLENTLKKYRSIALFGAGNMCRNYMKCYGAVYPPLFTCDNNQALWGTSFCGLEVKSPEALKDLPDDCGVFICNLYYREIEAQLRAMGVKHIEYFNDEYMSSYYFDRFHRDEPGQFVSP